jgi:hypothetical protein
MSCVVCIALGGDRVISCFEGVPICPYIVWGIDYMEVLIGYKLRSPTEYFSGTFLLSPTSFTTVRVVILRYE